MPLTLEEQKELEQLRAEESAAQAAQEAQNRREVPYSERLQQLAMSVGKMGLEGGGGAVGQAVGAFPLLSVPTAGMSVPILGAAGSALGYMAGQLASGEEITKGELAGAATTGAIPGGFAVKATGKELAKAAGRMAGASLAAKTAETAISEDRLPTATEAGLAAVGGAVGGAASGKVVSGKAAAKAAQEAAQYESRNDAIRLGQAIGFKTDPRQFGQESVAKGIEEAVGGRQRAVDLLTQANQANTNAIIRNEIKVAANAPLDYLTLRDAATKQYGPYREVAGLNEYGKNTFADLQQTRFDMREAWNKYRQSRDANMKGDPSLLEKAEAFTEKAEKLEDQLAKVAADHGNPDLVERLKDARKVLSKISVVESALNSAANNVDATIIGRLNDAKPGLLTEGMRAIGDLANIQPHIMREFVVGSDPGRGPSGRSLQLGLAAIGSGVGAKFGGPAGATAGMVGGYAAGQMANPFVAKAIEAPTQAALLNPYFQQRLAAPGQPVPPEFLSRFLSQTGMRAGQ
jgi:hypothetical protein